MTSGGKHLNYFLFKCVQILSEELKEKGAEPPDVSTPLTFLTTIKMYNNSIVTCGTGGSLSVTFANGHGSATCNNPLWRHRRVVHTRLRVSEVSSQLTRQITTCE